MKLIRLAALAALLAVSAIAQSTISDTIYIQGTTWDGTVTITWPAFTTAAGRQIAKGSKTVTVTGGALSTTLYPSVGGTPSVVYTATYSTTTPGDNYGVRWVETWGVPTSPTTVAVKDIRLTSVFGPAAGDNVPTGYWNFSGGSMRLPETTVASLPPAISNGGKIYAVTDGQNSADCTSGGGSAIALCRSNGTAWTPFGGTLASLNGLTTGAQTFARVNDTNVTLTIGSSGSTHTLTLGWTGTLAKARQHTATVYSDQTYTDPSWLVFATPTIPSFANAGHNHQDAAGGGALDAAAIATGSLPIARGGTGQASAAAGFDALSPMTTLGDLIYGGAAGTRTRLAPNTTATRKFLRMTGDGTSGAAPAWDTLQSADIPNNGANTSGTAAGLSGTPALPNGVTATTQSQADGSAKIATTAYVDTGLASRDVVTPSSSLPAASTATVGRVYRWTGATTANTCPSSGSSGSGGSAKANCVTYDGANWQAVLVTDTAGNLPIGTTVLGSSATASQIWMALTSNQVWPTASNNWVFRITMPSPYGGDDLPELGVDTAGGVWIWDGLKVRCPGGLAINCPGLVDIHADISPSLNVHSATNTGGDIVLQLNDATAHSLLKVDWTGLAELYNTRTGSTDRTALKIRNASQQTDSDPLAQLFYDATHAWGITVTYGNTNPDLEFCVNSGSGYSCKLTLDNTGAIFATSLKTTGSASGKKVVCVDTTNGKLYASSTGTDCSN
jgi:hypothetical protein